MTVPLFMSARFAMMRPHAQRAVGALGVSGRFGVEVEEEAASAGVSAWVTRSQQ